MFRAKQAVRSRLNVRYALGYFRGDTGSRTHVQLFRFLLVAVVAFGVDFGTLAVLVSGFHVWYLEAAAMAFSLGLVTSYILSTTWAFQGHDIVNRRREFIIFAITGLIGLGLTVLIIWLFTSGLGLHYLLSKLLTALIVVTWNFSSRKFFLYRGGMN